jgi:hypothetical protein
MTHGSNKIGLVSGGFILVAVIAVLAFFTLPDRRTPGEKVGDAITALPHGVDRAAGELGDKTPAEKAADAAGDKLSEARADLKEASSSASSSE